MRFLDIGELSARSGVPPSALRYYEEIGLLASEGRKGLRRQFGPDALLRLSLVALGRVAGFSLAEIAAMIGPDGRPALPRDELRARAEAIDRQIRDPPCATPCAMWPTAARPRTSNARASAGCCALPRAGGCGWRERGPRSPKLRLPTATARAYEGAQSGTGKTGGMAHIIVVGDEKGGSGKSTTCMHVATALVRIGHKVGGRWILTCASAVSADI